MKEASLNGQGGEWGSVPKGAAQALRSAVEDGRPVAVLTGAGVSAESGIPTFRGAGGLWRGFRAEELATPEAFARDPAKVWEWYMWRRSLVLDTAPNPAHHALATLERVCTGRSIGSIGLFGAIAPDELVGSTEPGEELDPLGAGKSLGTPDRTGVRRRTDPGFALITQNVDGLHQRADSRRVVELHGNIHHARCLKCGHVAPLPDSTGATPVEPGSPVEPGELAEPGLLAASEKGVKSGEPSEPSEPGGIPLCPRCHSRTRPHIVWFGEMLPEQPWREAHKAASRAAVLLVIGTSAAVYPAAGLVDVTLAGGGVVVEINPQETSMSHRATWAIRQPAGVAMPALLHAAGLTANA